MITNDEKIKSPTQISLREFNIHYHLSGHYIRREGEGGTELGRLLDTSALFAGNDVSMNLIGPCDLSIMQAQSFSTPSQN